MIHYGSLAWASTQLPDFGGCQPQHPEASECVRFCNSKILALDVGAHAAAADQAQLRYAGPTAASIGPPQQPPGRGSACAARPFIQARAYPARGSEATERGAPPVGAGPAGSLLRQVGQ